MLEIFDDKINVLLSTCVLSFNVDIVKCFSLLLGMLHRAVVCCDTSSLVLVCVP